MSSTISEQSNGNKENFSQNSKDNKEIQHTADIYVTEDHSFSNFMLSNKLLKSLKRMNFLKPSPIQLKVIPLAKCGLDMIIQAKSGTGKTLAFTICIMENYDENLKFPQSLVLIPTREIAVQIVNVMNELGSNVKYFKAHEFIGGIDISNDRKNIQTTKVVIGTPGRILHLIKNEVFNISNLKSLVLDEADKLLESGQMAKDVKSILKLMHKKIQIIATTATVTTELETIMKNVMKNPIGITPKHEIPVLLGIKQFVKILPREDDNICLMNSKIDELNKIFTRIAFKQCLLFTDSQSKTESYGHYLRKRGWKNEVINGAQEQSQRLKVLDKLVKFKCRILITTDLMARGIDIENINLIINLDLPYDCFTYLHRIGRAGRFGTYGVAITFINGEEDVEKFQKILGDIGGSKLKALKYPDESIAYDFWDFKQDSEKILQTISSISQQDEDDEQENETEADKIAKYNLTLLEITKKLVDNEKKPNFDFNVEEILKDYEQNSEDSVNNKNYQSTLNGKDHSNEENIFLQTIEELNLYENGEKNLQKYIPIVNTSVKEERQVIFQRTSQENNDEMLSESSENKEIDIEISCEDDDESEKNLSTKFDKLSKQNRKTKAHNKVFASENTSSQMNSSNFKYLNYHHYVSENYKQWENIFNFQLANIQSYVQNVRK
ncbi:CLUMA_CG002569, isoform A [Clunio marinus]|uniref:RNA helicase n=1 Tax=Clunio marinus TaxID=568069 RepID=A0A1J1HLX8_9DIPT|nr:CLUMA_CG002569, isoform A [Clunio marinus]